MQFTLSFSSPTSLLDVTRLFAEQPGTCLLFSGGNFDSAQVSFLGLFPIETLSLKDQHIRLTSQGISKSYAVDDPWESMKTLFFSRQKDLVFGWFGYDVEKKNRKKESSPSPDAYWQSCAVVLKLDHRTLQAEISVQPQFLPEKWAQHLQTAQGWKDLIEHPSPHPSYEKTRDLLTLSSIESSYVPKVLAIQEWIREGEVYQVNLAHRFVFPKKSPPFSVFYRAALNNPAPFSCYFKTDEVTVVCTSPERFLSCKEGLLESRPIKGTIPRGKSEKTDLELKNQLLSSAKEKAELMMITDLTRNDLGKISLPGTVKVIELCRCEAYTNVFHLLSIVQGESQPLSSIDRIRSCFPPGSITGCPKKRAVEAIDSLEDFSRGIYTGSLGYISPCGNFDLNVVIRTAFFFDTFTELILGSGIVIDSDPQKETEEILHKGHTLFAEIL